MALLFQRKNPQDTLIFQNECFVNGKKCHLKVSEHNLTWEEDSNKTSKTVLPLSQIIAAVPCECVHLTWLKKQRCLLCKQTNQTNKYRLAEAFTQQVQSVQVYYAYPVKKYLWRLTNVVFSGLKGKNAKDWITAVQDLQKVYARPKKLLIYINPYGGKKMGPKIFKKKVEPLFKLAGIEVQVHVTTRANEALATIQERSLEGLDGVLCIGGDGMFGELVNGMLLRIQKEKGVDVNDSNAKLHSPPVTLGVIPGGSTDAVVFNTTGINDPVTSTLLIIMGAKVGLDVMAMHNATSLVRFAMSLLGFGYLGGMLEESEKYRWMGPTRYLWAGLKEFIRHPLYEGVLHLHEPVELKSLPQEERCKIGCLVCQTEKVEPDTKQNGINPIKILPISGKVRALSVSPMPLKCAFSKKGLSPSAHLGDGNMDLVLVNRTTRLDFLKYVCRSMFHYKDPLDMRTVQSYRMKEFIFTTKSELELKEKCQSSCSELITEGESTKHGVWNCDGEVLTESSLRVRVHRQLIKIFAAGIGEREYSPT